MRINIVAKREAPERPYDCELFSLPVQAVPFLLQSIWLKSQKYWWLTPEDWERARSMLAEVGSELLMPCGRDIVNQLQATHALLGTVLKGTDYNRTGTGTDIDPFVWEPSTLDVTIADTGTFPSLINYADLNEKLVRNLVDGTTVDGIAEGRNFRQQLEDIRALLETMQGEDVDYTELFLQVIALLA